ncbi:MAG: hypothetical protein IPK82_08540 [Polyangiaceae bacterium]|nr:hypothetical protein [Polyangiaceae bacterium]
MKQVLSRSIVVSAVACVASACGGSQSPQIAETSVPQVSVAPMIATPAEEPKPDDPQARLSALACGRRRPCEIVKEHNAGKDAEGRSLAVALFYLGQEPNEDSPPELTQDTQDVYPNAGQNPTAANPVDRDASVTFEPNGERFEQLSFGTCVRYEYWRFVRNGDQIVEANLLAPICNDGHGAAGVGEDVVTVGANSFTHSFKGGASDRWDTTLVLSLSPFVRTQESWGEFSAVNNNHQETKVDWTTFSGSTVWFTPDCDENMEPKEGDGEYSFAWIPQLKLDSMFVDGGGWKQTALGSCAVNINATGAGGHVITGKAGDASDASMRLVASQTGAVFVEVEDDKIVGSAKSVKTSDHLEVWYAKDGIAQGASCTDPSLNPVVSWNITLGDGKVSPGFGKPKAADLAVEQVRDPKGFTRFRFGIGNEHALTFVYADTDDGKKVERRIATSRFTDGKHSTMGKLEPNVTIAQCAAENGALSRRVESEKVVQPDF